MKCKQTAFQQEANASIRLASPMYVCLYIYRTHIHGITHIHTIHANWGLVSPH